MDHVHLIQRVSAVSVGVAVKFSVRVFSKWISELFRCRRVPFGSIHSVSGSKAPLSQLLE